MTDKHILQDMLSLGALDRVTRQNGEALPQINRNYLETLRQTVAAKGLLYTGDEATDGRNKIQLPALYVYNGTKGIYTPSNICFVDIDTTVGVDDIINGHDKLFAAVSECCQIVAIQKSYSNKLHIIAAIPICDTVEQWRTEATWANLYILQEIKRIFGHDYATQPKQNHDGTFDEKEKAWDTHGLNFYQALSVSASEILQPIFVNVPEFVPYQYRKNKFDKLAAYTTKQKTESCGTVRRGLGFSFYNIGYTGEKVLIDKTVSLDLWDGVAEGTNLRWRIVNAAYALFGDDYIQFIKDYFVNSREILTSKPTRKRNRRVENWLIKKFDITPKIPVLHAGEYLTKYGTHIRQYIADNERGGIVAPTGAGKTVLIKEIAKEQNAVILCPYDTTVKQYHGVALLKNLRRGEKLDACPYVGTFDQALKFDLSEKLLIIDESHALFLDTDYRDRLNYLLHDLHKNKQQHLLLVTATPCKEFDILGVKNPLTFQRDRSKIAVHWEVVDGNPTIKETEIVNTFRGGRTQFDKLVIFDDFSAKLLYSQFPDESSLLATETKQKRDFIFTMERKLLANKLTFSTKVCFNGVDFNDDGNVLAVCRFTPGVTLEQHITQCVGRFRNPSARVTLLILEAPPIKKTPIADKVELSQKVERLNNEYGELAALIQKGIASRRFNDAIIAEINKMVYEYEARQSTRENVLKGLKMRGYFDLSRIYADKVGRSYDNKAKKRISDDMKKQLAEGIKAKDLKIDSRMHFATVWKNKLIHLTEPQPTGKVLFTHKRISNYVRTAKGKNVGAIITDLQIMSTVCSWTADDWKKYNEIYKIIFHIHKDNKRATAVLSANYKKYLSAYLETHQGEQTEIDWGSIDFGKPKKTISKVLKDRQREKVKYQNAQRKKTAKKLQLTCKTNNRKRIFATTSDAKRFLINEGYGEKQIRFLLKYGKDENYNIKKIVA